ncbi:T9SS type A sorting domain-containing protein [Flavobacterium soli]|uniref:T9SS type A sorting domain-containing protein n=1 Tax=Flavobacterium soli TaxID=344881 RepID=UPI00040D8AF6|nr:T9SS type A sorting domain-containing protein [Flavobacterium soli]
MKKITLLTLAFTSSFLWSQTPVAFFPESDFSGLHFGTCVETDNGNILVSSSDFPFLPGGAQSGKAYLFTITENTFQQTDVFFPDDVTTSDQFGSSITLKDNLIAIGAPNHDAGFENAGAVYTYIKTNGVWELLSKITTPDGQANDNFGSFVKIHNNQLFISAKNDDTVDNQDTNNGSVYIYSLIENVWVFSQKVTTENSLNFGAKIETENDKMVILSNDNATNGIFFTTYSFNDSNWSFLNTSEIFGDLEEVFRDFSLSNNQLFLVSSQLDDVSKIYILDDIDNSWSSSISQNLLQTDQLYTKIEVFGDNMLLGSTEYTLQLERKFPVLKYKKINGIWAFQNSILGLGPNAQDDKFGASIALDGNFAVVGAPEEGFLGMGKAYYFDVTLDVNEFDRESINIYPNPTSNLFFIKSNPDNSITNAQIYSITGSLLLQQNTNLGQISLGNFPPGIYFVKLTIDDKITQIYKVIKN